jgi:hypothetical protein
LKVLLLTARQQFSHNYSKREWVATSATLAIPKDCFSAVSIVVDFAVTLAGGPRMLKRCYSSITPQFVLACDRQSLASYFLVPGWLGFVNIYKTIFKVNSSILCIL